VHIIKVSSILFAFLPEWNGRSCSKKFEYIWFIWSCAAFSMECLERQWYFNPAVPNRSGGRDSETYIWSCAALSGRGMIYGCPGVMYMLSYPASHITGSTDPPPPQDPGYSACYNLLHARIWDCTTYCVIALLLASLNQFCKQLNFIFFGNKREGITKK